MDLKLLAHHYYATLQQAFKKKEIDLQTLSLSDNVEIIGPDECFIGKKNVIEMLEKLFIPAVKQIDIKHQYINPNAQAVCTVFDCIIKKSNKKVPTIEVLFFKHGHITKLLLFYDPAIWKEALE